LFWFSSQLYFYAHHTKISLMQLSIPYCPSSHHDQIDFSFLLALWVYKGRIFGLLLLILSYCSNSYRLNSTLTVLSVLILMLYPRRFLSDTKWSITCWTWWEVDTKILMLYPRRIFSLNKLGAHFPSRLGIICSITCWNTHFVSSIIHVYCHVESIASEILDVQLYSWHWIIQLL
jgi:hypothetical protein